MEKIYLPHVVLNGKTIIQNIFEKLEPLFVRDGTDILRTMELYLERSKNAILIDSLAIEANKKKSFLALMFLFRLQARCLYPLAFSYLQVQMGRLPDNFLFQFLVVFTNPGHQLQVVNAAADYGRDGLI